MHFTQIENVADNEVEGASEESEKEELAIDETFSKNSGFFLKLKIDND